MMMMTHKVAYSLVIIGALNWGLIALFDFNLVNTIFGAWPGIERFVYILVGLSALWLLMTHMMYCKYCGMEMEMMEKKKGRK